MAILHTTPPRSALWLILCLLSLIHLCQAGRTTGHPPSDGNRLPARELKQATRADVIHRASRPRRLTPRAEASPGAPIMCGTATAGRAYIARKGSAYYVRTGDGRFSSGLGTRSELATRIVFSNACTITALTDGATLDVLPNQTSYARFTPNTPPGALRCAVDTGNILSCTVSAETGGRRLEHFNEELTWSSGFGSVIITIEAV